MKRGRWEAKTTAPIALDSLKGQAHCHQVSRLLDQPNPGVPVVGSCNTPFRQDIPCHGILLKHFSAALTP